MYWQCPIRVYSRAEGCTKGRIREVGRKSTTNWVGRESKVNSGLEWLESYKGDSRVIRNHVRRLLESLEWETFANIREGIVKPYKL